MKNPRITKKEQNLIKGALRRVFSRSELRRKVISTTIIKHVDRKRPRVTKWSKCDKCKKPTPTYLMQLDHHDPLVPVHMSLEDMTWDEVVDRLWCEENNLIPLCKPCHKQKSKLESQERAKFRKFKKYGERK